MRCPSCGNENRQGARFCDACGAVLEPAPMAEARPVRQEPMPARSPSAVGAGRYRIKAFLGQGGRKRVYLADDAASDREVAVSLFDTAGVGEAIQARARREAQAMQKLGEHPHVVRVFDTGEEEGNPFIVSEYMAGGDVDALLAAEGGRLAVPRAVEIAGDVCRALEHAHARGIVHRDLKPANVWLDDDGHARLGDFGLATTEGRSRMSAGTLVGTVAYLPPEQALGESAGPESDLYSLGALLYEMLTGQPPFPGDDAVSIISQHLHSAPVPPSRHNPDVPEALDRMVLGLLAKRREERPASAGEVREQLRSALAEPPAREGAEAAENPLDSLAGGVFVGRERELGRMREAVDATLAGRGRLLLLVGEPGIGKTRAAEELATYARVQGARVHWGRCREDEGAPAYWPWVQALRSYVRESDPVAVAWQMGAGTPEIAQLVPEIAERQDEPPAPTDADSEEARFRLFDSVTTFLCSAGSDRPLVIVLDDLHWADEPSLLLLKFAAREVGSSGLLVVGTYRDVELGRHHPLARVLGELAGLEAAERISLRGLDVDDVERYIGMTAGGPVPGGLAGAVHAQTEGNPFFVGEVVRLLASEGRLSEADPEAWEPVLPQGVREVVGRRLDRLSAETNEALKVAAAIGREFEAELAIRVSELSEQQLVAAAREAVAERLVEDLGDGRFSFSHALVRDTLYQEISAGQRSLLHERIGLALEELHGDDPARLHELAHHFLAATPRGDPERAISYAERAARQAMEKLAYEEASELYERALEVLELGDEADEERRCRLLLALGIAHTSAACFSDARAAFQGAAASARARGDSQALCNAALGLAGLSEAGRLDEELIAVIEEALSAIGERDPSRRAALLSALGQELYWVDPQKRSRPVVEEAIEIARLIGDDRVLARALHRAVILPIGPGAGDERLAIANEMLELGRKLDDRETLMLGHAYRVREFLERADLASLDRELGAYADLAKGLRMPHHQWHIPALRAMRAIIDGELEAAERLAEEARARGERAEQPLAAQFYGVQLISLRRLQGRAQELLPAVRSLVQQYPAIPAWRTARASLAALAGDREEAVLELERLAADDFAAIPRDINWLPAMALMGEAAAEVRDERLAETLYAELLPYDGRVIVVGRAATSNGPVSRTLGLLAWSMRRLDHAERHLEAAVEQSRRMGDRPFTALGRAELARVLLERGGAERRAQALELLSESLLAAREMGARGVADLALQLRLEAQGLTEVDVTTSIDDVVSALETERPDLRAHAAPDGTVAILFSDIEDSTVLTERLGDERWLQVLREHNAVFREHLARHDGYEVKSQGDGFMLAFPDPCDALQCAAEVQRAFSERERDGAGDPGREEPRTVLRVRMGLHTGEVIAEEGDFFGKNVILAARIAGQANGGEILVSEPMREAVGETDGLGFDDGRELELKGLAGTHRVYRVEWSGSAETAAAH